MKPLVKEWIELGDVAAMSAAVACDGSAVKAELKEVVFPYGVPPLAACRSVEMMEVLIDLGEAPKDVGKWWAPGFQTHGIDQDVARTLVERGAQLTVHAAAGLGLVDELEAMIKEKPELVSSLGGDEATLLHFARDVATAELLLKCGVPIDARDGDHDSTAAQWAVKRAPEVTSYLIEQGAKADLFLAAVLGDLELVKRLVKADPSCVEARIGYNDGEFPGIGHKGLGGSIMQWTVMFNASPHQVAKLRGYEEIFDYLVEHSPPKTKFLVYCTLAMRDEALALKEEFPELLGELSQDDRELLAKYCWETNTDIEVVRLMLDVGFPIDVPEPNHFFMPLHNAAWCGDPELVQLLLERGHPVDRRDPEYGSSALGGAIHCCTVEKRHPEGRYGEVAKLLLDAGNPFDLKFYPVGDEAMDAVIKEHFELD